MEGTHAPAHMQPGSERGAGQAGAARGRGPTRTWALRPQAPQTEATEQAHPRGDGGLPLCPGRAPLVSGPDLTHHPGPRVPQREPRRHLGASPSRLLLTPRLTTPGPLCGGLRLQASTVGSSAQAASRPRPDAACRWAAVPAREPDARSGHGPWPPRPSPGTPCRAPPPGARAPLLQRADGPVPPHGVT